MRVELDAGSDRGMAWHFSDPLAEQRAMQNGDAFVRLSSREVFTLSGSDRYSWLHSVTTQDFVNPTSDDAFVLDALGRIHHAFSYIVADDVLWCWTEPGRRENLVTWIDSMKFWNDVQVETRDDAQVWWCGSRVEIAPIAARPSAIANGAEVIVRADQSSPDAPEAGQWAHEALRIDAGLPRAFIDTDDKTIPNEIGLYGTVLDKGCYPGQETVARIHNLGRPPRRLVRLLFDGSQPETGSEITAEGQVVGTLTSVSTHAMTGPVGLALIKRKTDPEAVLLVDGVAASQEPLVDPEVGLHFRPNL